MTWTRKLLVPAVLIALAGPAEAGIFSRKPKPNPAEHVPALIMQLKTDPDESKRAAAADELRQFDPKSFPEMMTVLVDAVLKDSATGVRAEAASTIGKLRPISQQAGYALEQAQSNDPAMRVRMAARQALWQYHIVGYRSGKPTDPPAGNTAEATAQAPQQPPAQQQRTSFFGSIRPARTPFPESPEPPLAGAVPAEPMSPPAAARPGTPNGPALQPASPPRFLTPPGAKRAVPPASAPREPDGPALLSPGAF